MLLKGCILHALLWRLILDQPSLLIALLTVANIGHMTTQAFSLRTGAKSTHKLYDTQDCALIMLLVLPWGRSAHAVPCSMGGEVAVCHALPHGKDQASPSDLEHQAT